MQDRNRLILTAAIAWAILFVSVNSSFAPAQEKDLGLRRVDSAPNPGLLLKAEEIILDQKLDTTRANRGVELIYGDRLLQADSVQIHPKNEEGQRLVSANGDVMLVDPNGSVTYADRATLEEDLHNFSVENLGAHAPGGIRIVAKRAERDGNRTSFEQTIFTPCQPCKENPERAPLWNLRAQQIIHDRDKREIVFHKAFLDVMGAPILYFPFLSQPDLSVKRKTGFLLPDLSISQEKGVIINLPYFIVLNDRSDLKIEPVILTEQGGMVFTRYRRAFNRGSLDFIGSVGAVSDVNEENPSTNDNFIISGHAIGLAQTDLTERTRARAQIELSSNDAYPRRFDLSDNQLLTSSGLVEHFGDQSYFRVQVAQYRKLSPGDVLNKNSSVAPYIELQQRLDSFFFGSLDLSSSTTWLFRNKGMRTLRLSNSALWSIGRTSKRGHRFDFEAILRGDFYDSGSQDLNGGGTENPDEFAARSFLQATSSWRYPLIGPFLGGEMLFEPTISVVTGGIVVASSAIPNEDSNHFELSGINLLDRSRFPSHDRVERASRVGFGTTAEWRRGPLHIEGFSGQSLYLSTVREEDAPQGHARPFSDIVGRLQLRYEKTGTIGYRMRFDPKSFRLRREEWSLETGLDSALQAKLYYTRIDRQEDEDSKRKQLHAEVTVLSGGGWKWSAFGKYDVETRKGLVWGGGLDFENECLFVSLGLKRSDFRDRELRPDSTINLRVSLRNVSF